ncbi:hypothetical protein B7759_05945 (plasmid) [Burkholderia glumae]|nr:hypothetical protein KS03_5606 [Burkholderia glumae LMG 2196 = ATCC 33617]QTP37303.1 hypothetical protein B7759_05945 [Burkholderia glumae]
MADVGFHRTDKQRLLRGASAPVDLRQRGQLNRVAERGARAMRLDIANRTGFDAGVLQRGFQQALLRPAVRHGQPAARAVMIDRRAANHRQDPVTIRARVVEPLQHDHAGPFAPQIAVGCRIERVAAAGPRQRPDLAAEHRGQRRQHQRDAARERHAAFTHAQALARLVDRDQARRARRVDKHRRPLDAKHVGEPARRDARCVAEARVRIDTPRVTPKREPLVIMPAHAHENAARGPPNRARRDSGVLERFPAHLQQQPLLRIERHGLALRDAEERRVKAVHRIQETAAPHVHLARCLRIGIEEMVNVPAVRGTLRRHVPTVR